MKSFIFLTLLFGVVTFGAVLPQDEEDKVELPQDAIICSQNDPNLNQCIKNSLQDILPKLINGFESLNIPPIDPFVIPSTRIDYNTGAIQGTIIMKNVKTYGMSKAQIRDVRTTFDEIGLQSEIDSYFPRIFIEGNYKGDIKLNDFKMSPRGYFNISMSNIKVTHKMSGKFETRDEKKYLKLTTFDAIPNVGNMKIYATGLFPDPQLNQLVLDFINQYWSAIYQTMLPETRSYWEPLMLNVMNNFLLRVPFEMLLTKN